ncbi:30S ribosomal protein S5 [Candidatus Haliotispira prima]|uniref:Small ribosomal subunit protein uS5 n=1 Tax=Candidatus Haliotispira prima TaxID=3034016 RepID=A0ABY8MFY7_9SPIO|nr:30S ribosomal protein S5 [Candidatus Haliotispira prima]
MSNFQDNEKNSLIETLIEVKRISKAVKGGRKMSFSALMVVGDGNGKVGYGLGKANDVAEAIRKSTERAKRSMIRVPLSSKHSTPYEIKGKYKKSVILIKPAAPGTGIIAGGSVRAVLEAAGIKDVLAKSLGSNNSLNMILAALEGLGSLIPASVRAKYRGKELQDIWG